MSNRITSFALVGLLAHAGCGSQAPTPHERASVTPATSRPAPGDRYRFELVRGTTPEEAAAHVFDVMVSDGTARRSIDRTWDRCDGPGCLPTLELRGSTVTLADPEHAFRPEQIATVRGHAPAGTILSFAVIVDAVSAVQSLREYHLVVDHGVRRLVIVVDGEPTNVPLE